MPETEVVLLAVAATIAQALAEGAKMSIIGLMRTSVSGMEAQSQKLGVISGNVSNSDTVGYKSADALFSTFIADGQQSQGIPSGVTTSVRYEISKQGVIRETSSQFDLAVSGQGFFLVSDAGGQVQLTRSGKFVPEADGRLVNSAGLTLLGFSMSAGQAAIPVVNGTAGLVPVVVTGHGLEAAATRHGQVSVNLPSTYRQDSSVSLPSLNLESSAAAVKTSLLVYGKLGEPMTLDLLFARKGTTGEWEVAAFDAAKRSSDGSFPYLDGPLATDTLKFDDFGKLISSEVSVLSIPVPGGEVMQLDLLGTTQLASDFRVDSAKTDGRSAAYSTSMDISEDGIISQVYGGGLRHSAFAIPLARVPSPDQLRVGSGNTFLPSEQSGGIMLGVPGNGGLGTLARGALEVSTVDLSGEMTELIEAQRSYSANSKVFQAGSEILDIIVNLKR